MLKNQGSTARDFLTYERNFLSQSRFGFLLSLLASSFLLRARLPTPPDSGEPHSTPEAARNPFGYVYFCFGFSGICLALLYYVVSSRRLTARRAFLGITNIQTLTLALMALLIIVTCIFLLAEGGG